MPGRPNASLSIYPPSCDGIPQVLQSFSWLIVFTSNRFRISKTWWKEKLYLVQRYELWVTIMSVLDTSWHVTCIFCKWHFAAFSVSLNVNACRYLRILKSVIVIIGWILSRNTQLQSSAVFKTTGQRCYQSFRVLIILST